MSTHSPKPRYPAPEPVLTDPDSGFQIVRYANGSFSLKDPLTGQVMHSMIGPREEAQLLYAQASGIAPRLTDGPLVLWDVGMGTGANVTASLDVIGQSMVADGKLEIFSFENDLRALRFMLRHLNYFDFLRPYADQLQALLDKGLVRWQLATQAGAVDIRWYLLDGDFYQCFNAVSRPDLIFFDFYAPAAVPQLWIEAGFRALREFIGEKDCRLHTYAAATPIRLHLLLAGFYVGYGPRTSMKTDTTVAATRLELLTQPLGETWRQKLRVSTAVQNEVQRQRGLAHPQWELLQGNGEGHA